MNVPVYVRARHERICMWKLHARCTSAYNVHVCVCNIHIARGRVCVCVCNIHIVRGSECLIYTLHVGVTVFQQIYSRSEQRVIDVGSTFHACVKTVFVADLLLIPRC